MKRSSANHWIWPEQELNDRVVAFTTTRAQGSSLAPYNEFNLAAHVGDDPQAVANNRQQLSEVIGIEKIQWLDQVHGTDVVKADRASVNSVPSADAAWTDSPGIGLAILTADCLPVVFAAADGCAVGVAHAGWRGLLNGVLEELLKAMPGTPGDYVAWIGPAISQSAYEVGEDVAAAVRRQPRVAGLSPGRVPGKFQLDLPQLASVIMKDLGVADVVSCGVCSSGDSRTYSYRRDGQTGRMATLAWISDPLSG